MPGPGLWPGPCRQARRAIRLRGQRRAAGASARRALRGSRRRLGGLVEIEERHRGDLAAIV